MLNGAQGECPPDTPCPGREAHRRAHGLCNSGDMKCAEWESAKPQTARVGWFAEVGGGEGRVGTDWQVCGVFFWGGVMEIFWI